MVQRSPIQQHGFTLVELMVTLAVLAILAALAAPSYNSFMEKQRLISVAEDLYGNLQQARSESIARFTPVFVNFDTSGATWAYGLSQNTTGCDPTVTTLPATGDNPGNYPCFLVIDDGDATLDDGKGVIEDGDDLVLYRFSSSDYNGIDMSLSNEDGDGADVEKVQFNPQRGTTDNNATITLTSDNYTLEVEVNLLGRVRICSPNGNVGSYNPGC